jgi:hypothetical protein
MLDGKQYIAVMGGTGAIFGRGGGGGGGRGAGPGGAGVPGRGAPPAPGAVPTEPTAAAAQGGNNVAPQPAPVGTGANNNPKLLVYAVAN